MRRSLRKGPVSSVRLRTLNNAEKVTGKSGGLVRESPSQWPQRPFDRCAVRESPQNGLKLG